jgi:hypothetical protein
LLTHADGRRVTTPEEFFTAVGDQAGDVTIRIISGAPGEVTISP